METTNISALDAKRDEVARRIVRQIEALPPMPETALKLRAAANDPNADFARLVPLIEKDPGLCADLLRFANSAAYGAGHPVETVGEAVLYFGMENLVEYILLSYSTRMVKESFGRLRHLDTYFRHSEQVSAACEVLARRAGLSRHDAEVCKVAGLLHNVGKLVLSLATEDWAAPLLGTPWSQRSAMMTGEESRFGFNHCEVGAMLCEKWQFPAKLVDGIRNHHRPLAGGGPNPLASFVYLGELLVIDDLPMDVIARDFSEEVLSKLGLSLAKLDEAREQYRQSQ
jgi:putative nucleotidyltransferase with HDIG domain